MDCRWVTVTFDFVPKILIVVNGDGTFAPLVGGLLVWAGNPGAVADGTMSFTLSGKTLSWGANSATFAVQYQMNSGGSKYYYIAIG